MNDPSSSSQTITEYMAVTDRTVGAVEMRFMPFSLMVPTLTRLLAGASIFLLVQACIISR